PRRHATYWLEHDIVVAVPTVDHIAQGIAASSGVTGNCDRELEGSGITGSPQSERHPVGRYRPASRRLDTQFSLYLCELHIAAYDDLEGKLLRRGRGVEKFVLRARVQRDGRHHSHR